MEITKETLENLSTLSPEEQKELQQLVMASPQYKELQSQTTKGVQIINEAAEFYIAHGADETKLAELKIAKPEVYDKVMTKFHGKDVKSEDIDQRIQKAVMAEKVKTRLETYAGQLSDDEAKAFNEKFNMLTNGRDIDIQAADEFAKAAMALVKPDFDQSKEIMAKIMATGSGGGRSQTTDNAADKHEAMKNERKKVLNIK